MKKTLFYFLVIAIFSYLVVVHVRKNENFSSVNNIENKEIKIANTYGGVDMSDNEINRLLRSKYANSSYSVYNGVIDYWDIYDSLARNQPWYAKLGNGLVMAFFNIVFLPFDMIGLFYGIVAAVKHRDISALWNNKMTNAIFGAIKNVRKDFYNYKSKVEQERSWWENFGTAAFFADYILEQIWIVVYIYLCYFVKKQFKWSTSTKSPKKE